MRMRRKKHLDERLAAVKDYVYISDFEERDFRAAVTQKEYIDLSSWFEKEQPLYLEIGCGKGRFAVEYALRHPEINLLAVEKSANVIVDAAEAASEKNLPNLRFIKCGAEYLERHLKEHSVERIFLNFSCPFPKKRYASHRLTHRNFLEIYRRLLKTGGEIHQKTDNQQLFEFSIEQMSGFSMGLKNVSLDLHNSDFEGNIMTEYEERFVSQGLPIYRLEAYFNQE